MQKNTIIFLDVPKSLKDEISFEVNPSIPLPVELEGGEISLDPEMLSWEMIISGMLRIISAYSRNDHSIISKPKIADIPSEWIDYYRGFVLTVKPEIFHEFSAAAIVKAKNGEYDMALEISAILEGLFPGSPGVLLNKALFLEDKAAALEKNGHGAEKENAEALEAYETALAIKPVLPDTLFNAGFFYMRRRDFISARECFSAYISAAEDSEIPPENPAEKTLQAKKILQDIKSQGLDDPIIKEAYDCIYLGNDNEGLLKIREFLEKHPKVWNGWFYLGWALRKLGRYNDGLEALKKAVELGGNSSDIQNEMAICLMELGDLKGAKKELEQALRRDGENTKIISNLGVLAMKAGNMEEAEAFFRAVHELDSNDPLAKHILHRM